VPRTGDRGARVLVGAHVFRDERLARDVVEGAATYNSHVNGHVVHARAELLRSDLAFDIAPIALGILGFVFFRHLRTPQAETHDATPFICGLAVLAI